MGSLAEDTPEDRRTKSQRTVIPLDGERRPDSDHILRVHTVHPKHDPGCLEQRSPARGQLSWKPSRRKSQSDRESEPTQTHKSTRKSGTFVTTVLQRTSSFAPLPEIDSCPPGQAEAPPPRGPWKDETPPPITGNDEAPPPRDMAG